MKSWRSRLAAGLKRLRKPRVVALRVGSLNCNAKTVRKRPDAIEQAIRRALLTYHVISLQEMPEGQRILNRLERDGFGVWRGAGKSGQNSTPIVWQRGMTVRKKGADLLTPRTWVGRVGAGASPWLKPRWLMSVRFEFEGRTITVTNLHSVSSVWAPGRANVARRIFTKAAALIDAMPGQVVSPGDYNTGPGSELRLKFAAKGIRSAQKTLGPIITFQRGRRRLMPDDQLLRSRNGSVEAVAHVAQQSPSDHHLYGVEYAVKPRKQRRKS